MIGFDFLESKIMKYKPFLVKYFKLVSKAFTFLSGSDLLKTWIDFSDGGAFLICLFYFCAEN